MLAFLRDGTISLSVLCRIEPFLREPDAGEILSRAAGSRRHALEELVAELNQRRAMSAREETPAASPVTAELFDAQPETQMERREPAVDEAAVKTGDSCAKPDRLTVRAPGIVRISFDAPTRLRDKLERIGNFMAFKLRTRRLEELVEILADEVLARLEKTCAGRKRMSASNSRSRRVPLLVRRQVRLRDGDRCAFTAEDGTRCVAVHLLQYDHIRPWALGGRSDDPGNIRLLCRAHNLHLARKLFPAARRAAERAVVSPPAR